MFITWFLILFQKFICNVCLVQQRDESEIISHVQLEHDSQESYTSADAESVSDRDSTSDTEMESSRPPMKRQNNQRQTPKPKPPGPQRESLHFPTTLLT